MLGDFDVVVPISASNMDDLAGRLGSSSISTVDRVGEKWDMRMILLWVSVISAIGLAGLFAWRQLDHRADRAEMDRLIALQPQTPARYEPQLVANLPEPARRYFNFTIAEGTPLYPVSQIEMEGQFSLGTQDAPNYMDMTATQVLAAPEGFVWKMSAVRG